MRDLHAHDRDRRRVPPRRRDPRDRSTRSRHRASTATGTTAVRSRSAAHTDIVPSDRERAAVPATASPTWTPARRRPRQHLRRVPRAHDVDDAVRRLGASGPQQHALLLRERDPAVARRVRGPRYLLYTDGRAPGAVLRARAHPRDLRPRSTGICSPSRSRPAARSRTSADATSRSGVLLGLGAAAKLYPALLVVPFVAGRFRGREPDRGIHLAWAAAGTWIAVEPPVRARRVRRGWLEFFSYNTSRPADWDSLWFVGLRAGHRPWGARTRAWSTSAPSCCSSRWVAIVWTIKARRDPGLPAVDARVPDPGRSSC